MWKLRFRKQYLDRCNIEYLKTAPEKRKDKLRNIVKQLVNKPEAYSRLRRSLEYSAKEYKCSIHALHDPHLEYPEDFEW